MRHLLVVLLLFVCSYAAVSECIPIEKAKDNIGSNACVTGKVFHVGHTSKGTTFLDFCEDYKNCPFVVVIFARDLRDVGDVTQLEGKVIEISGKIEEYNGRAEIVLRDIKQLRGDTADIPAVPKTYDAAKHGTFSAGKKSTTSSRTTDKSHKPRRSNIEPDKE